MTGLARAREAAITLSAGREEVDDSFGLRLLADIRDIFQQTQDERVPTAILLSKLNALEESPWGGWRKDKSMSSRNLATLLKPYGISSKTIRMPDGTTPRGYEQEAFVDAFSRYLPLLSATSATEVYDGAEHPNLYATQPSLVADNAGQSSPLRSRVADVAAKEGVESETLGSEDVIEI